jgi:hypothetical protein
MDDDILAGVAEDWQIVLRVLPAGWQDKARELGALRRHREFPDAATLLRVLLIHLAEGCSLRETAVRAAEGQLVTVSDVALLKRLRVSGEWFRWMGEELMRRWMTPRPVRPLLDAGSRVRIVDGSTVNEPGATGSTWRLHYAVGLPSLACEEVRVTDTTVGESLCQFQVAAGDLLIADRGFANRNGVRHVHRHGGAVIVRLNLTNLPLIDREGHPFALLSQLRTLDVGRVGDWPVAVVEDKRGCNPSLDACARSKRARQQRSVDVRELSATPVELAIRSDRKRWRPPSISSCSPPLTRTSRRQPSWKSTAADGKWNSPSSGSNRCLPSVISKKLIRRVPKLGCKASSWSPF